ncbi:MAG: Gfo/Idh/MocA family oxidoreductase [Bacteroidia bacterium]|nr:Gfo/Idh/MocA family oxidoreductase [Bacteroidia bacterium]
MLRTGVIGAGHLGKIHIRLLQVNPRIQVIGFYDTDSNTSNEAEKLFSIKAFPSTEQLIENCEAVVVASPTPSHFQYAKSCLQKGKHVFIEKPLTTTIAEAEEIAVLEKQTGLTVQTGHVERYNPAFKAAASFINNPMFIEGHRLAQFNPRGTDVSVVYDLMIHDIDIILSVVKSEIKNIHASGVAVVSDSPDIANARIEFENGCTANLTASRISMKNMRKARFFQQNAYISVDFLDKKSSILELHEVKGTPDPLSVIIDLGEKGQKQIYIHDPKIENNNAIQEEHDVWIDSILNKKPVTINAAAGAAAVRVANQISETIQPVLKYA